MSDTSSHGFTTEQIFRGVAWIWRETTGDKAPITPDTRITDRIPDGFEVIDLEIAMADYFGEDPPDHEDWSLEACWYFHREQRRARGEEDDEPPPLTFQMLVEFIESRAVGGPIEPVYVLGKQCLSAGAFRAIEEAVHRSLRDAPRFPPSDPVLNVLRGQHLRVAWDRMRWLSDDRLPRLKTTIYDSLFSITTVIGFIALIGIPVALTAICSGISASDLIARVTLTVVVLALAGLGATQIARVLENPLPAGLRTWRSVAKAMVGE